MRNTFYKGRFIFFPILAVAAITLVGFVVMQLWNNLLPGILHVSTITFWQALGIFVLCKILFGFGGGGPGKRMGGGAPWGRARMEERFKNMSPEEKERFRAHMDKKMCGWRGRHHGGEHPFGNYWEEEADKTAKPGTENV